MSATTSLSGKVHRIRYEADEGRFQVVLLEADNGTRHTVVLRDIGVRVGERLVVTGTQTRHKSGELQLSAETCERKLPSSIEGIEAFLSSGVIRGVGPKLAHEIVATFGSDALNVLDRDPDRLAAVPGVGAKRIADIKRTWSRSRGIRDVLVFLRSNGISGAFTKRIYDTYGARAVRVIEENPYRLARDVRGIGFGKADAIASSRGIRGNDPRRVRAGIEFALETALSNGHVLRPVAALVVEAAELLGVDDDDDVRSAIETMTAAEELKADPTETAPESVYLPSAEAGESELAQTLARLIGAASRLGRPADAELESISRSLSFSLDEGQASALKRVLGRSIGVLTGGPGTGKTTIVRAAVAFAKLRKMKIRLGAPTGRAAKRLSEATGIEASTVHRLLEFDPRSGEFKCNTESPIDADLVIVDEASMLDQTLTLALGSAVRSGTALLLVGDADQLPSVGAGNVLGDIIESDCVPVATLKRVFRQAGDSEIVSCAHAVLEGASPVPSRAADGEFFFVECRSPEHALDRIVHLMRDRMPAAF